jgi:hypothetical protein
MNDHGNSRRARALLELVSFASRSGSRAHFGRSDVLHLELRTANLAIDGHFCNQVYVATFDAGEFED